MKYLFTIIITLLLLSCSDDEFNVQLVEGAAPTEVKAQLQINGNNPWSVTVMPEAIGATAFEVRFGVPNETPQLIGIEKTLSFTYPDNGEYTVTITAIGGNNTTASEQFPVEQDIQCAPILVPAISFENNEDFFSFNGVTVGIVANPDVSGANPNASNVLEVVNSGADFEGFGTGLSSPASFSSDDKKVMMKVWSTSAVDVRLIFQGGVDGARAVEGNTTHAGSGWEVITFDYQNATKAFVDGATDNFESFVPTGMYGEIVMFIEPGKTTSGTFYIDDIGSCE